MDAHVLAARRVRLPSRSLGDVLKSFLCCPSPFDLPLPNARLCIETFRGPFQWFELPLQLFQVNLGGTTAVLRKGSWSNGVLSGVQDYYFVLLP